MKIIKRIGITIVSIVLWCVILLAALYAFTILATRDNTHVANIAGYTPMVVESNSMAPEFYKGDLIFIKTCDTATLQKGDVICFHTIIDNQYALNTHRIEDITEDGELRSYTTKGDNNDISDTHIISDGDIVGIYVGHLSSVGKVMDFLSGSIGFMVIIVLPMLIFFIYQVYHLIMVSINLKKAVALEAAQAADKQNSTDDDKQAAKQARAEAEKILAEAQRIREEAEALKAGNETAAEENDQKTGEDHE